MRERERKWSMKMAMFHKNKKQQNVDSSTRLGLAQKSNENDFYGPLESTN